MDRSRVADAIGGTPVAPPMDTTALELGESFSSPSIAWVLIRSIKGHFGPEYFTPVDFVGLYWHLVDLIWIFLFPLLYLIH